MITEYQVGTLRHRLSQQVRDVGYHSFSNINTSAHTFKYDCKWYKISIKIEEISLDRNSHSVKFQM